MSFLAPSVPKPPPPAAAPITANATQDAAQSANSASAAAASLINTGPAGLQTRANTSRTSLLGGGS